MAHADGIKVPGVEAASELGGIESGCLQQFGKSADLQTKWL